MPTLEQRFSNDCREIVAPYYLKKTSTTFKEEELRRPSFDIKKMFRQKVRAASLPYY